MKKIDYNFRSAGALGIISCFVLFLSASGPHRVHHLFDNLPYSGGVLQEQTRPLSLTASSQAVDTGDQGHTSHDHDHLAKADHHAHNRGHHSHRGHPFQGNSLRHGHDKADQHGQPESQAGNTSPSHEHTGVSDAPLEANAPYDDAHHDNSAQTVCLLQSAAQHSHLSAVQLEQVAFLLIESRGGIEGSSLAFSVFNSSPFSQRAPPST